MLRMDRADRRNPDNIYHKMAVTQLGELTPHFSWDVYFKDVNAPEVSAMNIEEPDFFKAVDAAFTSVPLDDWKMYLRWHLVHSAARGAFREVRGGEFRFLRKDADRGRRRCCRAGGDAWKSTDRQLGEALGQYYVQRNFPPEAKAKAIVMVQNLMAALRDDLQTLDWMSPATREQAIKKLHAITSEDRLSGQMAGLFGVSKWIAVPTWRTCCAGAHSNFDARPGENRQAGGPHRMGHDAADGERLLQSVDE